MPFGRRVAFLPAPGPDLIGACLTLHEREASTREPASSYRGLALLSVGIDPHKHVFSAVAIDAQARAVASFSGRNHLDAFPEFLSWLEGLPDAAQIAIEGAYSFGRPLARFLLDHGFTVFDCNPRWTAAFRKSARRQHKTDAADAAAVAQVLLRDGADLPQVLPDDASAVLDVLVSERNALLAEMTRARNQLHALLFDLGITASSLATSRALASLRASLPPPSTPRANALTAAAGRIIARLLAHHTDVAILTAEIEGLAAEHYAPLTSIPGVGLLTAGAIAAELGSARRFLSDAQLAAFAAAAPIEASSAGHVRHRLNRGGNRKLNAILYRVSLTQRRHHQPARDYIARRQSEGKTLREAIRAHKRFIVRAIFRAWQAAFPPPPATSCT